MADPLTLALARRYSVRDDRDQADESTAGCGLLEPLENELHAQGSVTVAAMLGRGDDVRGAHWAPPDALGLER
jgi:hypothetical protein